MRDQTLRGSRLGGRSLASDEGVELSPRKSVTFRCESCDHPTVVTFALEADEPDVWSCSACGRHAVREGARVPASLETDDERPARTPFDMLLERRTREELEVILEERLQYLRARRGEEHLSA